MDKEKILNWITTKGMNSSDIPHLLDELTQLLNYQGMSIMRSVMLIRTLHPEIEAIRYAWEPIECGNEENIQDFLHPELEAVHYAWWDKDKKQNLDQIKDVTHSNDETVRYNWDSKEDGGAAKDTDESAEFSLGTEHRNYIVNQDFTLGKVIYELRHSQVMEMTFSHGIVSNGPKYKSSPYSYIDRGETLIRNKISKTLTDYQYPVIKDLQELGATDYVCIPLNAQTSHTELKHIISWATNRPDGFSDEDIRNFQEIAPILALCLGMHINQYITQALLKVYLGQHSGQQVYKGKIQRGDVENIHAAIWYSDLRGFTDLSEKIDSSTLVQWLNDYFDAIAMDIFNQGGEILKFIGDAVLAIFPIGGNPQEICQQALEAAVKANESLAQLNENRKAENILPLNHGIALHLGNVQYGNIGALRRLDFTVIGQAVNLAARIEGLCGKLSKRVLMSENFAESCGVDDLVSMGSFDLKGIEGSQHIYSI